jgi:hypothetical protein
MNRVFRAAQHKSYHDVLSKQSAPPNPIQSITEHAKRRRNKGG